MKRLVSFILVVALVLSAVCAAAAEGVTFTTEYFTLQLPDNWVVETEDLESSEEEECLGLFAEDVSVGLVGGAYLVFYEDLKEVSLWSLSEEELQVYAESVLDDYADCNPELIGIVMAGRIPLVLIKGADETGDFLYADTMTNGYAIEFNFFVIDDESGDFLPIGEEEIEQVKTILATFQPAA